MKVIKILSIVQAITEFLLYKSPNRVFTAYYYLNGLRIVLWKVLWNDIIFICIALWDDSWNEFGNWFEKCFIKSIAGGWVVFLKGYLFWFVKSNCDIYIYSGLVLWIIGDDGLMFMIVWNPVKSYGYAFCIRVKCYTMIQFSWELHLEPCIIDMRSIGLSAIW